MHRLRLERFSFRFAEQVLNARLSTKQELESVLLDASIDVPTLSRPVFNATLDRLFVDQGWDRQPPVFDDPGDPSAKMDFLKDRVGVEVGFGHASFMGIDLLKFQVASYSALNKIDVGVYVTTTRRLQKILQADHQQNWDGSLTFEKVCKYLPYFKSAIQVPIYVVGIDC
jgi:hypothetical protein